MSSPAFPLNTTGVLTAVLVDQDLVQQRLELVGEVTAQGIPFRDAEAAVDRAFEHRLRRTADTTAGFESVGKIVDELA